MGDEHVTSLHFHLRFIVFNLSLTFDSHDLQSGGQEREGAGRTDQVVASAMGRAAG